MASRRPALPPEPPTNERLEAIARSLLPGGRDAIEAVRSSAGLIDDELVRAEAKASGPEGLGLIELSAPVVHPASYRGNSRLLLVVLGVHPSSLPEVLEGRADVFLHELGSTWGVSMDLLHSQHRTYQVWSAPGATRNMYGAMIGSGPAAIARVLSYFDGRGLLAQARWLREAIARETSQSRRAKAERRLEVLEAFRAAGKDVRWLTPQVVPVVPVEGLSLPTKKGKPRVVRRAELEEHYEAVRLADTAVRAAGGAPGERPPDEHESPADGARRVAHVALQNAVASLHDAINGL